MLTFCRKCGNELVEGAKFCPRCGMAVDSVIRRSVRESYDKPVRKPMSSMTIAMIVIVASIVIVGLLSTVFFFGGWRLFGEVVGSGNLVTNQEFISDFTAVDARGGFNVEISESNSFSVLVTTDDNIVELIELKKSGDTLIIGVKWGYSLRSVTLDVEITVPELHSIELSGGSRLTGEFETARNVDFDLSGGSLLSLVGEANDLTIDASSGSQLDLSGFEVNDANVELSGGSSATINLVGRLDADLSGGSQLSYIGDATLGNIETSGGSEINKQEISD